MSIHQVFSEKIVGYSWMLFYKDYHWILPLKMRSNELLCNQLFDLLQMIFMPCNEFPIDVIIPAEKPQLMLAIFYDRMIREDLIKPAQHYKFNSVRNVNELEGVYNSLLSEKTDVFVKVSHDDRKETIGLSLRSITNDNPNKFEVVIQFHQDCIASLNSMRLIISFLKKIQREYL